MDRERRIRLIKRTIRATAEYLHKPLTDHDINKICDGLDTTGRPTKEPYKPDQLARLERVDALLQDDPSLKPHRAFRMVADQDPGHSESATYHWLRRHYKEFKKERKSVSAEVLEHMLGRAEAESEAATAMIEEMTSIDPGQPKVRKK